MAKTILGVGAHYDDCVFGIPGILLKAVRKNYRVVILSLIGDYSNWKPARGREREIVDGSIRIAREFGVEMRFLSFAEMKFDFTEANKRSVADAIARIGPDVAFMLWPRDSHADHEIASRLSKVALRHGDRLLEDGRTFKRARQIYLFDNGPRHTVGFEPDTYVDISDEWPQVIHWLGQLKALVKNEKYDPEKLDSAQRAKETLSTYRGHACGVRHAEALRSANAYPQEIF